MSEVAQLLVFIGKVAFKEAEADNKLRWLVFIRC